jgi:hypothetical protein
MTTSDYIKNDIEYKRRRALAIVKEMVNNLDKDSFTVCDFALDRFIREQYKLLAKELGKAPYDFIDN